MHEASHSARNSLQLGIFRLFYSATLLLLLLFLLLFLISIAAARRAMSIAVALLFALFLLAATAFLLQGRFLFFFVVAFVNIIFCT